MASAAAKNSPVGISLGAQIDSLYRLRETIREVNEKLKDLEEQKRALEETIVGEMDVLQVDKSAGKLGSVTISEQEIASIEDWDAFNAFIKRNNYFFLLQRRVNNAPYRELLAERKNKPIPGAKTIVKRSLNLRKR
jgi:hypothetical protein